MKTMELKRREEARSIEKLAQELQAEYYDRKLEDQTYEELERAYRELERAARRVLSALEDQYGDTYHDVDWPSFE